MLYTKHTARMVIYVIASTVQTRIGIFHSLVHFAHIGFFGETKILLATLICNFLHSHFK